jgi:hypothetical protein
VDTEVNYIAITVGEPHFDENLIPTTHRLHRSVDLEVFYFNNEITGEGNCDRTGPVFDQILVESTDNESTLQWSVRATDEGGVWRIVVLFDDEENNRWVPIELEYEAASGRWVGTRAFSADQLEDLTFFLQAVDDRGNVSWAEFEPQEAETAVNSQFLPELFEVSRMVGGIFSDGFETGNCSAWSACSGRQ